MSEFTFQAPYRIIPVYDSDLISARVIGYTVQDKVGNRLDMVTPKDMATRIQDALALHDALLKAKKSDTGTLGRLLLSGVIPLPPVTKKNSQQIVRGKTGRAFIIPSARYAAYLTSIKKLGKTVIQYQADTVKALPLSQPMRLVAHYYRQTRHRVDGTNLESALCDVLVDAGFIKDDDIKHVHNTDGRRVFYDNENARTEFWLYEWLD